MLEDFEGYEGKITDMTWTYKGTKTMLLPWYDRVQSTKPRQTVQVQGARRDGIRLHVDNWAGRLLPDVPWQLRKTYIIEQKPKDPAHPIGHRVYHMDAQTNEMGVMEIYDRKNSLWKLFFIGWPMNDKGVHPIKQRQRSGPGRHRDDYRSQARHCTTLQFRGRIDPSVANEGLFNVQNLRGGD